MRWLPASVFGSDTQAHWVYSAGVCTGTYCMCNMAWEGDSYLLGMQSAGKLSNIMFILNDTVF